MTVPQRYALSAVGPISQFTKQRHNLCKTVRECHIYFHILHTLGASTTATRGALQITWLVPWHNTRRSDTPHSCKLQQCGKRPSQNLFYSESTVQRPGIAVFSPLPHLFTRASSEMALPCFLGQNQNTVLATPYYYNIFSQICEWSQNKVYGTIVKHTNIADANRGTST